VVERFLIDKGGQVYPAFDEQFAAKFGYPVPDFDLPSYAVRNLGAVDIEISDLQTIVRFRSLFVTATALSETADFLLEAAQGRITIQHEDQGWTEESFADPADAAAWLRDHGRGAEGTFRNIATTPLDVGSLSERRLNSLEQPHDRLALAFKKWRIKSAVFDGDLVNFMLSHSLLNRAIIVSESMSDKKLFFEHFGSGFTIFEDQDPGWKYTRLGRPVDESHDMEYAMAIANTYRRALDENKPRFDHVDALVRVSGEQIDRFVYDRLLLPCKTPQGMRVLVTTSYGEHRRAVPEK
jgi:hypothetical protein